MKYAIALTLMLAGNSVSAEESKAYQGLAVELVTTWQCIPVAVDTTGCGRAKANALLATRRERILSLLGRRDLAIPDSCRLDQPDGN